MYPKRSQYDCYTLEPNSKRYEVVERDRNHARNRLRELYEEYNILLEQVREKDDSDTRAKLEALENTINQWELEVFSATVDRR